MLTVPRGPHLPASGAATAPPDPAGIRSGRQGGEDVIERGVGEVTQLPCTAILNGVGNKHGGRREAQSGGLGGSGGNELRRGHQYPWHAAPLEVGDVVHTARRATPSISEGLDDHIAVNGDLLP